MKYQRTAKYDQLRIVVFLIGSARMAKKAINELFKTTFHNNSCSMSQIGKGFRVVVVQVYFKIMTYSLFTFYCYLT